MAQGTWRKKSSNEAPVTWSQKSGAREDTPQTRSQKPGPTNREPRTKRQKAGARNLAAETHAWIQKPGAIDLVQGLWWIRLRCQMFAMGFRACRFWSWFSGAGVVVSRHWRQVAGGVVCVVVVGVVLTSAHACMYIGA